MLPLGDIIPNSGTRDVLGWILLAVVLCVLVELFRRRDHAPHDEGPKGDPKDPRGK
jgi:hypothetical protein